MLRPSLESACPVGCQNSSAWFELGFQAAFPTSPVGTGHRPAAAMTSCTTSRSTPRVAVQPSGCPDLRARLGDSRRPVGLRPTRSGKGGATAGASFAITSAATGEGRRRPQGPGRRVRRQQTLNLITSTDLSFSQVAVRVGLREQSSLTRAVRRWFGMSPSRLRSAGPSPRLREPQGVADLDSAGFARRRT